MSSLLKDSVARTTHQQYAALVRKYLIPGLGKIRLKELTAQDFDDLYADMEQRGVGERTARYVHQVVSFALEAARKHLVPYNVARYAAPPPIPEGEEQLALTLEELSRFVEVARGRASRTTSSFRRFAARGCRRSSASSGQM